MAMKHSCPLIGPCSVILREESSQLCTKVTTIPEMERQQAQPSKARDLRPADASTWSKPTSPP